MAPLEHWTKGDVLTYLKARHIPIPKGEAGNASGMDLTTPAVLHLYDNFRDDFDKVARVFPYVWAIVKRRDFYG